MNEIKDKNKTICWTYLDEDLRWMIKMSPELNARDKAKYKKDIIKTLKKVGVKFSFMK